MKILLLSCCAPCSCAVIERMVREGRDFTVAFYNPNIVPYGEYEKRKEENKRLCDKYHVSFIELEYDNEYWRQAVKGYEEEPERGKRCDICFYIRLKRVMKYAQENGFDVVSSVLGVSRYKDLSQVNRAAEKASQECGIPYFMVEGRKGGMQDRRQQLIKELNLYSQNYCGCHPRSE